MIRPRHLIVITGVFLIGCAVALVVVGCAGVRSGASQGEQERTEATKKEQARSPEATASEEARCEGTRTFRRKFGIGVESFVTNDLPGCPKGGLLSGTDKLDTLDGRDGDDKIRGLGHLDVIYGGLGNDEMFGDQGDDVLWAGQGNDVLYGGPGVDQLAGGSQSSGCCGKDVFYGGNGNDQIDALDGQRDKLYCGEGTDHYSANEADYVDSSCEKKGLPGASM